MSRPLHREEVIRYLRRLRPAALAILMREALGSSVQQIFLIDTLQGLSTSEIVEIVAQAKGAEALEVAAGLVTRAGARGGVRLEALLERGPAAGQVVEGLLRGLLSPK